MHRKQITIGTEIFIEKHIEKHIDKLIFGHHEHSRHQTERMRLQEMERRAVKDERRKRAAQAPSEEYY
jgi:demethoxyubiquinone hydroxylase (CLK1/Coq7/Cat5 family)